MDAIFLQARIDRTKDQILAIEAVLDEMALEEGAGTKSYTLNTGQTVQTVTKHDMHRLEASVDSLMNRLVTLEARQSGGTVHGVPGW